MGVATLVSPELDAGDTESDTDDDDPLILRELRPQLVKRLVRAVQCGDHGWSAHVM